LHWKHTHPVHKKAKPAVASCSAHAISIPARELEASSFAINSKKNDEARQNCEKTIQLS